MPSMAVLAVAGSIVLGVGNSPQGEVALASWSPAATAEAAWPVGFWEEADPADSLYKAARAALNKNDYSRAADLFRKIRTAYPKSQYTPDAYYWEAFALYRRGGTDDLKSALSALDEQDRLFPNAGTQGDAGSLAARIRGELAKRGDSKQAEKVDSQARAAGATGSCSDDDDDTRIAALNALLQMDADRAIPILKKVLARRDACSEVLRRKAVFLVSQKRTAETETILLNAAKTDPDEEVRQQSVFWLSQVGTETAVSALDSILRSSTDEELQKKAIFALSQMDSPRANTIIRGYAERPGVSKEVQQQAIFWIGQDNSSENATFLKGLYKNQKDQELKEKIMFSLSQMKGQNSERWLMDVATDTSEDIEMRKKALFWAGQSDVSITELTALYGKMNDQEMKEQLIFVYSQRNEKAAVDKLLDIAKNEPNKELKKKAIFWLSQSQDPRAADLLQQIIDQ